MIVLLRHCIWWFSFSPVQDSDPAQVEGEWKVKRGLSGMPSAVPRIHLPSVRSRLLPRHPHLPSGTWLPCETPHPPSTALRAPPRPCWRPLVARESPAPLNAQSNRLEHDGGHLHRSGSTAVGTESVTNHLNWDTSNWVWSPWCSEVFRSGEAAVCSAEGNCHDH